jgi:outer membrane lipoprotein-sorting protein
VGDGDLLYYYNPLSNQVRQLRPSQTGDLRVPLSFLLGRLHFRTYDPADFELTHLKVDGQDESVTTFTFSDETVNPNLEEALFHFQAPPGAEVVDQAGSGGGN